MTGTPTDLLIRMRERLAEPERWTQHAFARNADGKPVATTAPAATCWCMVGALMAEPLPEFPHGVRHIARHALVAANGHRQPETINDFATGHTEVLDAIDRALAWLAAYA